MELTPVYRQTMTFIASKINGENRFLAYVFSLMFVSAGLFSLAAAHSLVDVAGGIVIAIVSVKFLRALHLTGGW
jgi:high-affinity Fe2+/Pb2+ permease